MTIFIGGAWPYSNYSLHLGHLAGLLPGDVIARYYRLKGEKVLYVSGSDCHGTPVTIQASQEKVEPKIITDKYHKEFFECFQKLGFSYDLYSRTDQSFHCQVAQEVFLTLFNKGYICKKNVIQLYCESCSIFLPDRFVEGNCPKCGQKARGDQCDHCSALLEPVQLLNRSCKLCGGAPIEKETEHLYFTLSKLQAELEEYVKNAEGWRENARNESLRYLREGLQDRAITRDLPWGVDVPLEGYEGKKIYVWIDAVCGYLSASKQWAAERGTPEAWREYWDADSVAYYAHGKDNIPFHTIILPALLKCIGDLKLPDRIVSSEHLTLEGRKISKSDNWGVWVPYILDRYDPDSIRYFLLINGPEKRDGDFSWREFIGRHNSELVGVFGNFVNRTLAFINKSFEGEVPKGNTDKDIKLQLEELYNTAGSSIEAGELKAALEYIISFLRRANKYFDEQQPWATVKTDISSCNDTLYSCVQIIANLSILLEPFIPFASHNIRAFLRLEDEKLNWRFKEFKEIKLQDIKLLFERIDAARIEEEVAILRNKE
ncbi:MAG: methionine--tRNA ligase [Bacillota bacterium]